MSSSKFSDEFKRDAVAQVTERGYPVREVSERLGVSPYSLYAWKKRFAKVSSGEAFLGIRFAGRNPFFERGDLCLRLGDGSLLVFQRQFQLRRVQLFRFRPELRVPVILNLAFQPFDQRLQFDDEGVLLGHHRLLVLARRPFDRRLEARGFQGRLLGGEGLHYLGRKVRKQAEIEGLRHVPLYPIQTRKPSKTR